MMRAVSVMSLRCRICEASASSSGYGGNLKSVVSRSVVSLMLDSEKKIFDMMDEKSDMSKYWMPLIWATNIINRARKENLIASDHLVQTMLMELSDIRRRLGSLIGYDTVCVPLVYTQVVTLSVYMYFLSALMGRQFVEDEHSTTDYPDMYFPLFTVLQFFFYIGWLKVAEVLINPFGEDDDDIELNWLIDRHIKDQYWDEVVPKDLPYTVASEIYRRSEPKGSAEMFLQIKPADSMYANLVPSRKSTVDDMYADYESVDTPLVERRKNWFQRQLTRMGSSRSSITTYSTGPFGPRGRHNSVYSSPDVPIPQHPPHPHLLHKASLYDRLVGRKSVRGQVRRQDHYWHAKLTTVAQAGRSQTGSIDRPLGKDHLTHGCSAMWSVEGGKGEQRNELVRQKKVISLDYVPSARHWPDRIIVAREERYFGFLITSYTLFVQKVLDDPRYFLNTMNGVPSAVKVRPKFPRTHRTADYVTGVEWDTGRYPCRQGWSGTPGDIIADRGGVGHREISLQDRGGLGHREISLQTGVEWDTRKYPCRQRWTGTQEISL
uniref:Bestrophin homolog n=1 Tax=Timema bartmani TaxID=61472 RepID=A0A7R9ENP6_9NEOP|nr:unnamed protein product [Timema bartmani]